MYFRDEMYFHDETVIAVSIIVGIISIIMWLILANEFHKAAYAKGFHSRKYFWLPFIFGVFGAMVVIALPDRGLVRKVKPKNDELPDL